MYKLISLILIITYSVTTTLYPKGERVKVRGQYSLRPLATGKMLQVNSLPNSPADKTLSVIDKQKTKIARPVLSPRFKELLKKERRKKLIWALLPVSAIILGSACLKELLLADQRLEIAFWTAILVSYFLPLIGSAFIYGYVKGYTEYKNDSKMLDLLEDSPEINPYEFSIILNRMAKRAKEDKKGDSYILRRFAKLLNDNEVLLKQFLEIFDKEQDPKKISRLAMIIPYFKGMQSDKKNKKIRCIYAIARKINQDLPLKTTKALIRAWMQTGLIALTYEVKGKDEILLTSKLLEKFEELLQKKYKIRGEIRDNIITLKKILARRLIESSNYWINLARSAWPLPANSTPAQRAKVENAYKCMASSIAKTDFGDWNDEVKRRVDEIPGIISDLIVHRMRIVSEQDRICRFNGRDFLLRKDLFNSEEIRIAEVLFEEGLRIVLYNWSLVNETERFFEVLSWNLLARFKQVAILLELKTTTNSMHDLHEGLVGLKTSLAQEEQKGEEKSLVTEKSMTNLPKVFQTISSAA